MVNPTDKGFTLIELLVVISIIAVLASISLVAFSSVRENVYYNRTLSEFRSMETALEIYKMDHNGQYPADAARDMPAGLSSYLAGYGISSWPRPSWPGSYYDWDNWVDPNDSNQRIYQISIRFCPAGDPDVSHCNFPKESWARNFGVDSAVYYCISGNCISHEQENVAGYCVNCAVQPDRLYD